MLDRGSYATRVWFIVFWSAVSSFEEPNAIVKRCEWMIVLVNSFLVVFTCIIIVTCIVLII